MTLVVAGTHATPETRGSAPLTTADAGAVRAVRAASRRLSDGAMSIVSSVVGAPSVAELRNALGGIEPDELNNLRKSFSTMGI